MVFDSQFHKMQQKNPIDPIDPVKIKLWNANYFTLPLISASW